MTEVEIAAPITEEPPTISTNKKLDEPKESEQKEASVDVSDKENTMAGSPEPKSSEAEAEAAPKADAESAPKPEPESNEAEAAPEAEVVPATEAAPEPETEAEPQKSPENADAATEPTEQHSEEEKDAIDLNNLTDANFFDVIFAKLKGGLPAAEQSWKKIRAMLEAHWNLPAKSLKSRKDDIMAAAHKAVDAMATVSNEADSDEVSEKEAKKQKKAAKKAEKEAKRAAKEAKKAEKEAGKEAKRAAKAAKKAEKALKSTKKSRKRKKPSSDDEESGNAESGEEPSMKRQRLNDGKQLKKKGGDGDDDDADEDADFVVESESKSDIDGADGSDSDDNSSKKKKKKVSKGTAKKKGRIASGVHADQPLAQKLTKMRKLLRAVGLANPSFYSQLKDKSNKEQIKILEELFSAKEIAFAQSDLSDKAIAKAKSDHDMARELADLNITSSDVPQSEGRSKRTRKKVDYRAIYRGPDLREKMDEDSNDEKDGEDGAKKESAKEDEEEYAEPPSEEEEESEGDEWQPSAEDDDDDGDDDASAGGNDDDSDGDSE